jgi:hypothetical protein
LVRALLGKKEKEGKEKKEKKWKIFKLENFGGEKIKDNL